MRDYGKIAPSFWTRGTGKLLRGNPDGQVLALYLATCPAANIIGIFYIALATIAHETGLSPERVAAAMAKLRELGFAIYDEDTETVWIPNLAAYQVAESLEPGDKRRIGLVRAELKRLGKHPFLRLFWEKYGVAYGLGACPLGPLAANARECDSPQSSSIDQEQEQEQEQKQKQEQGVRGTPQPSLPGVQDSDSTGEQPSSRKAKAAVASKMREDWQPRTDLAQRVTDLGLHLGRVLTDFREHWIGEGIQKGTRKTAANWDKTFAANIRNIRDTQWLRERFAMTQAERLLASLPPIDPDDLEQPDTGTRRVADADDDPLADLVADLNKPALRSEAS